MLKKSAFAVLAALAVATPFIASDTAQAQSRIMLKCWHDGNPKHFRPECRDPLEVQVRQQVDTYPFSNRSRSRAGFNAENLFDQMMLDSGGGAGGGGGR